MDDPVLRTLGSVAIAGIGAAAIGLPIAIIMIIIGFTIGIWGIPMTTRYYRKQIRAGNWDEVRRLEQGAIDLANRGKDMRLIFRKFAKIRREEGLDY